MMRVAILIAGLLFVEPVLLGTATQDAFAGSKETCQRGCNARCHGAPNKAKCVAQCRRACR
ncbi:hypothetical protein [Haliangium sp. UPWRP_2]|uniref:hypothetical protein n=1 Tax=Haliangium sp. UPWRP_2 TaxID=1931276 RepID=UPI000B53A291|nr:hypothetical protein [Haliangium sp. UPWRP_2]PSM31433.1 hypothetical protein BVG81_005435 [Haliangium sp. UPWRP_2]